MAQGSARFLLEFQVTGDQEVIARIKGVGTAGKETASELQALQGIEDPFAPIAQGAEEAIEPITRVGTAAGETVGPIDEVRAAAAESVTPITDMGSATDEAVSIFSGAGTQVTDFTGSLDAVKVGAEGATGSLGPANQVIGDFGSAADTSAGQSMGFGEAVGTVSGSIAAIGGAIGTAISGFFRYQDAQNRVLKAQTRLNSFNEAYRKGQESLNAILAATPANQDAIAAASQRLADAEARVTELMRAGITTGDEWTAAQAELQSAQAASAAAVKAGGGDWQKATDQMEKNEIQIGKNVAQENTLAKTQRESNQAILDQVLSYVTLAGSLVQVITGLGRTATAFRSMGGIALKALVPLEKLNTLLKLAPSSLGGALAGFALFGGLMIALKNDTGGAATAMKGINDAATKNLGPLAPLADYIGKTFHSNVQGIGGGLEWLGQKLGILPPKEEKVAAATDNLGASQKSAAAVTATLTSRFDELNPRLQENAEQTDLQSAALDKLIGPTTTLSGELNVMTGEIDKLTQADVQSVAATEQRNRAMIVANSGVQNAIVAAIQYEQALTAETQRIVEDTDNKIANTRVNETMTGSTLDIQNAIAGVNEEYSASVRQLAAMEGAMANAETRAKAVATAVNQNKAALMEESIQLDANIQSLDDAAQAQMRLDNAKRAGILAGKEFIATTREEIAQEHQQIGVLEDYAEKFGGLPEVMQPTVENLEAFIEANERGGQAAVDFQQKVLDAYSKLSDQAKGLFEGLTEAFAGPMKEQAENITKAWEKVGADVKASLSGVQRDAITTWSKAQAEIQQGIESFSAALLAGFAKGMDLSAATEQARGQIQGFLDNAAAIMGPGFEQVFAEAKDIAATGSAEMINEMVTALQSKAPADEILKTLKAINAKDEGTRIGTDLTSAIGTSVSGLGVTLQSRFGEGGRQAGAAAGTQAGTAFVSEWDANVQLAGNALQSIVKTASTLKVDIPITANIQQAGAALASIQKTGSTLKVQIPVTADVSAAHQAIAALVTKQQTATITYNIVTKGTPPVVKPITTTITYNYKVTGKPPVAKPIKQFISYAYRITNKIPNPKEIKRFISYAYRITNRIPNPPEIKRFITYRYRVTGSRPNPPNLNRTITYRYRTVGSRPAQSGMHETLADDTMIAAHKGERVDITPGGSTFKVPNIERTYTVGRAGGGGGARPINVTVIGEVNGKELIRFTRRGIMEEASGMM